MSGQVGGTPFAPRSLVFRHQRATTQPFNKLHGSSDLNPSLPQRAVLRADEVIPQSCCLTQRRRAEPADGHPCRAKGTGVEHRMTKPCQAMVHDAGGWIPRTVREPGVARPRHPHTSTIRWPSQHPLCRGIDRTAPTGRSTALPWSQTAAGMTPCASPCRHPRRWGMPSAWTAGRARAARLSSSYSSKGPARWASWTAELCLARPR